MSSIERGGEHHGLWRVVKDKARREIAGIDARIMHLFGDRLQQVGYVDRAKRHLGDPVVDQARRDAVIAAWEEGFTKRGFRPGAGTILAEAVLKVFEGEQHAGRANDHQRPQR